MREQMKRSASEGKIFLSNERCLKSVGEGPEESTWGTPVTILGRVVFAAPAEESVRCVGGCVFWDN